jgi:trk system potassium uptake protein
MKSMDSLYNNERIERFVTAAILAACAAAALSFALLLGFEMTGLWLTVLYVIQVTALLIFIAERLFRMFTARSISEYAKTHWLGLTLLAILLVILFVSPFSAKNTHTIRHYAIGTYLLLQIVGKISGIAADIAAHGRNPAQVIVTSFIILIIIGAIFLMLPKSTTGGHIGFVDALFTSTSAVCLTGLTVQDTGGYFSYRGQLVILSLIQMGAMAIMVFGAVFALIMRQAWNASERAAMQDMLAMEARSRLGRIMLFIFVSTAILESLGALCLMGTWPSEKIDAHHGVLFVSVFHSVSAFCNSGFTLFSDSLRGVWNSCGTYLVVCPLIILGGLGFGVLYDITRVTVERVRRGIYRKFSRTRPVLEVPPRRVELQTKVVLVVSAILIVGGAIAMLLFESILSAQAIEPAGMETAVSPQRSFGILDALFQSITARTAGFSTVDIGSLSGPSLFVLLLLMLIGGSPGSVAGGMKTVTIAILVMAACTTLRKRSDVEIFNRSIPLVIVGRAITIMLLFLLTLFAVTLLLCITERNSSFTMGQLFFEAASAVSATGLTTGITSSLTTAGKLLIILAMIIGRLGPLTLLTWLALNVEPARYSYPEEPIMTG